MPLTTQKNISVLRDNHYLHFNAYPSRHLDSNPGLSHKYIYSKNKNGIILDEEFL